MAIRYLVPSFTGFFPDHDSVYGGLLGFTGFCLVFLATSRLRLVRRCLTDFYWVEMGFIGFYWVLLGFSR